MVPRHRGKSRQPVLRVAASVGGIAGAGLLVLNVLGWVKLWVSGIVLWGAFLAWALQQYLDLRAGLYAPKDRTARLRFAWTLAMLVVLAIGVVVWFAGGY